MLPIPRRWKIGLLIGLIVVGAAIGAWQPVEFATLLDWGEQLSESPLAVAGLVVLMIVLVTFALPGSFMLWLIAPFHPPLVSTGLLVAGSVGGALGAYGVATRLSRDWEPEGLAARVKKLLEKRSDALTQCALRVLPGFPHSVINYLGGTLGLRLATFVGSAVVGLGIKWGVYSAAVHGTVTAMEEGEAIGAATLAPLVVVALLMLAGAWVRHRMSG